VAVDSNTVADAEPGRLVDGYHLARALVTRNLLLPWTLQILTIGAAYRSRSNAHYDILISRFRPGYLIQRDLAVPEEVYG
jgi:hypothetical protein